MRATLRLLAWMLAVAAVAAAGEPIEEATRIEADLFAREGPDILYAIGHVRLQRGTSLITADGAVIWVRQQEAYLEGQVTYRMGKSVVQAERVYVHWTSVKDPETGKESTKIDRGFVIRGDVRWNERPDRVPWRLRSAEVLQTDVDRWVARGQVILSSCLYHEPHAYFRASEVVLVANEKIIIKHLSYQVQGVALDPDIQGWWVPPVYWPYLYIPLGWEWPELTFEAGRSGRYGTFVKTEVLYPILAEDATPIGVPKLGLRFDYFSKRGAAYGTSLDYERRDGLIRGKAEYYRLGSDDGKDHDDFELGETDRYRWKYVHTQDTPEGWEFDIEFQRYSDAGFRQEFFEREFYTEKPVENRVYLKRYEGPFAGYAHVRWQSDEWLDTTEYLPQVGFNVISYPLAPHLIYTGHFEIANVHRRLSTMRLRPPDPAWTAAELAAHRALRFESNFFHDPLESTEQEFASDDQSFVRFNMYHELAMPGEIGFLHVEPFVGYRGTYYSELNDGGSGWRSLVVWGLRANAQFYRTWDDAWSDGLRCCGVKWLPLEVNGLRHIITPEIRVLAVEDSGVEYGELILTDDDELQPIGDFGYAGFHPILRPPAYTDFVGRPRAYYAPDTTALAFGDVNDVYPFRVVNVALRNRWQTHRRGRVVDLIDLDLDLDFFFGDKGVNNGNDQSDLRVDFRFRPVEGVTFFADFDYNIGGNSYLRRKDYEAPYWGDESFSALNWGLYIHTSRRWQLVLEQRHEPDHANYLGFRLVYHPDEKWRLTFQYAYDTEESDTVNAALIVARDMHDWIAEFVFESDSWSKESIVGFRLQPKLRRELISGLYYTRDLGAAIDRYDEESYQHYDY